MGWKAALKFSEYKHIYVDTKDLDTIWWLNNTTNILKSDIYLIILKFGNHGVHFGSKGEMFQKRHCSFANVINSDKFAYRQLEW